MSRSNQGFTASRRRPRPGLIALIVLAHLAALYGLSRALAPDFTAGVERRVVAAFIVTVTAPEEPPLPEPASDEGAQGEAGERATPPPRQSPAAQTTKAAGYTASPCFLDRRRQHFRRAKRGRGDRQCRIGPWHWQRRHG